jgi:hypothetical protein
MCVALGLQTANVEDRNSAISYRNITAQQQLKWLGF